MYSRLHTALWSSSLIVMLAATNVAAQDSSKTDPAKLRPPPRAVSLAVLNTGVDSVTAAPGENYSAWVLHRFFFGDLYRDVWNIPLRVKVLRLDSISGGLKPQEVTGGKQTLGLRLIGEDSVVYQFRSLVKASGQTLPATVQWTPFAKIAQDQMAGQFPLAPLIVAELLEAVDVLVAKPRLVVMADDERLGEYRAAFAGLMGWLEVRPQDSKGDRPGFAGASKIEDSFSLYDELRDDPNAYVNVPTVLRARMVDFLIGDWDRHSDQWRWASFADGLKTRWEPIARDRDWAFPNQGGIMRPAIAAYAPGFVPFREEYPKIWHLAWVSQRVDRTLLTGADRSMFISAAREVAAKLNDKVLEDAVALLPPAYAEVGKSLLATMRIRRDNLEKAANEFYELLASEVDIDATVESDSATITSDGETVRVQLHVPSVVADNGTAAQLRYDRTFLASETKEVRLYLRDGADRVVVKGRSPLQIEVRIITGDGDDNVIDQTSGANVLVYNGDGEDKTQLGKRAFVTDNHYLMQDSIRTAWMQFSKRDWGSAWLLTPSVDHQSDIGLLFGGKLSHFGYGFGQQPCHSCLSLEVLAAPIEAEWTGELAWEKMIKPGGWWISNSVNYHSGRPTRFYGFGNESVASSEAAFTGFRPVFSVQSGLKYESHSTWNLFVGALWRNADDIEGGGAIFNQIGYGSGQFQQVGLRTALELDTRDVKGLPTRGIKALLSADYHPTLLDVESPFASVRGSLRWFGAVKMPFDPALHVRLVGEKVWGDAPFDDIPYLGGSSTLPGFSRANFRGDAAASANALLRARAFSLMKIDFGVHGITGVGRVWQPGEESSTWHQTNGYGAWLHLPALGGRTLSVTFANGARSRMYFDFGFIF